LERRDQIGRRRPGLDLHALDLLTRDLLLDCLQEALPVLVLVLLGLKLGLRQLADEPLGERPFLVADLGLGVLGDLGCVMDLVGEVEPLEEEPVLMYPDRDRCRLPAPGERADGNSMRPLKGLRKHAIARSPFLPAPR